MNNSDVLLMAVKNLMKRKLRTFLTALGVIVGSLCIVIVISISIGINRNMEQQLDNFGDVTVITINNWNAYYGNSKNEDILDDEALKEISALKGVEIATPVMEMYFYVKSGRYTNQINIRGLRPDAMEKLGYKAAEGRLLTTEDTLELVFPQNVVDSFINPNDRSRPGGMYYGGMYFGGVDTYDLDGFSGEKEKPKPLVDVFNDRMTMSFDYMYIQKPDPNYTPDVKPPKPYTVTCVGILGEGTNWELSYYTVMNIDELKKIKVEYDKWQKAMYGIRGAQTTYGYERAMVKCKDAKSVKGVSDAINRDYTFSYVYSPTEWVDQIKEMLTSLQMTLSVLGGFSLLIATIGIANTMFASVYERTREIGVMKVIGATLRDIRRLFLLESAIIGLVGGLVGIGVSFAASMLINKYGISFFTQMTDMYGEGSSQISYIPGWLCLLSLGVTALIGLISGYFPARYATKLSALTAIRTE